jgi:hypothetical protein
MRRCQRAHRSRQFFSGSPDRLTAVACIDPFAQRSWVSRLAAPFGHICHFYELRRTREPCPSRVVEFRCGYGRRPTKQASRSAPSTAIALGMRDQANIMHDFE